MQKYGLYLFDFDGTLVDSVDAYLDVYIKTFSKFGKSLTKDECTYFIKYSLPDCMKMKGMDLSRSQELIDVFHNYVNDPEVIKQTIVFEDTFRIIKYLNDKKIPYGIITGNSYKHINMVFEYYKIDISNISTVVGNERFKFPKPDPDSINIALKDTGFNIHKEDVIYIGDSPMDEKACNAAGIKFLYINRLETSSINSLHSLDELFE